MWSRCWEKAATGRCHHSSDPGTHLLCAFSTGDARSLQARTAGEPLLSPWPHQPNRQQHLALSSRLHPTDTTGLAGFQNLPTLLHLSSRHQSSAKLPSVWAAGHMATCLCCECTPGLSRTQRLLPGDHPRLGLPGNQELHAALGSGRKLRLGRPLQAPGGAPCGRPAEDNCAGGASVRCWGCGPQGAGCRVSAPSFRAAAA